MKIFKGAACAVISAVFFLMLLSAVFSSRDTCACEMPISLLTSICVFPTKKRSFRIFVSRSVKWDIPSLMAMLSSQQASVVLLSLI